MDAARLLEEGTDESFAFYRDAYLGQANVETHDLAEAPYGVDKVMVVTEGAQYLGKIFVERNPNDLRISLNGRRYNEQRYFRGEQPDGTSSFGYTTKEGAIEFLQLRLRR